MATIKLLTVFSTKSHQNFINMNYSIFKRTNNFIKNSTYLMQSKDYVRENSLQGIKGQTFLFVEKMKTLNRLCNSFNTNNFSTQANEKKEESCPEQKSDDNSNKKSEDNKNLINNKELDVNIDEAKEKASAIVFKGIAYVIYAFEVILASNELKLMKQLTIKGYYWAFNLFHEHILKNPNIKDALNEVKGKVGKKD